MFGSSHSFVLFIIQAIAKIQGEGLKAAKISRCKHFLLLKVTVRWWCVWVYGFGVLEERQIWVFQLFILIQTKTKKPRKDLHYWEGGAPQVKVCSFCAVFSDDLIRSSKPSVVSGLRIFLGWSLLRFFGLKKGGVSQVFAWWKTNH